MEEDEEKVYYCLNCLSLNIKSLLGGEICYCGDCNSADIGEQDIEEWQKAYKKKYGVNFIETNK